MHYPSLRCICRFAPVVLLFAVGFVRAEVVKFDAPAAAERLEWKVHKEQPPAVEGGMLTLKPHVGELAVGVLTADGQPASVGGTTLSATFKLAENTGAGLYTRGSADKSIAYMVLVNRAAGGNMVLRIFKTAIVPAESRPTALVAKSFRPADADALFRVNVDVTDTEGTAKLAVTAAPAEPAAAAPTATVEYVDKEPLAAPGLVGVRLYSAGADASASIAELRVDDAGK